MWHALVIMRRAFVTGGTGFVGSHVVRKLRKRGIDVKCLVRPSSIRKNLENLGVEYVEGDLRNPEVFLRELESCDTLFHVAADYRLWAKTSQEIMDANVEGTRCILEAAQKTGIDKIVYTSSVAAVGRSGEGVGDETMDPSPKELIGPYKASKHQAELVARDYGRKGLPIVIVNPSTPVGSHDIKPTPTGKTFLDFLNGKMPAYVDTGLNLVDVEDVAEGHILAAQKGQVNRGNTSERYILGNRNMTLKEILDQLSRLTGIPSPRWKIPYSVAWTAGYFSTTWANITGRPPSIPLDGVKMSRKKMFYKTSKAIKELSLPQTPIETALEKAVRWFQDNGYTSS